MPPRLIDAHAHLFFDSYDQDRDAVIANAQREGIAHVVTVGTDLGSSRVALAMAQHDPGWQTATAGIHPHDSRTTLDETTWNAFAQLACDEDFAAIGECGLDYFKNYAPRDVQRTAFRKQIHLANELGRPLVIHTREAHEETVALLRAERDHRWPTVIHCFTGSAHEAHDYLELGFFLSFSGVLTYPRNEANRDAARIAPIDRLMIETDAPFLSPQPERGRRNEPALLRHTFGTLSTVRDEDPERLAAALYANTAAFFRISV
ncbi:MAG: TatD family hydrolase [Planctomycetes bacterium]|nr:TatD family hydrolase [Planctomycetota bacterium]